MEKDYQIVRISDVVPSGKLVNFFNIRTRINTSSPGQYYMFWVPDYGEISLPISNFDKNSIDFMICKNNEITKHAFAYKKKKEIFLRGPYGHGFPMNNFVRSDVILIASTVDMSPISSAYDFLEQNKKNYGLISFLLYKKRPKKAFIKKLNRISEIKEVGLIMAEDEPEYLDHLDKMNKKDAFYLLSLDDVMLKKTLKKLVSNGVSKKKIYAYVNRNLNCANATCGRCMIYGVHICKDGPVFRSDRIWRFINDPD